MRSLTKWAGLGSMVAVLLTGAINTYAQPAGGGMGNFDPAQFRQRMMDGYRERMGVKDDEEWKLIQTRIEKVMEARQATMGMGGFGMFGGMGRRGGGPGGPGGPGGGGFGGMPSNPQMEALQSAVENNASKDEIKAKLTAYREARKAARAKLEAAQAELQKVLTQKQEAAAVLAGLLE